MLLEVCAPSSQITNWCLKRQHSVQIDPTLLACCHLGKRGVVNAMTVTWTQVWKAEALTDGHFLQRATTWSSVRK